MRSLDPEALAVRTGRRGLPPPERDRAERARRGDGERLRVHGRGPTLVCAPLNARLFWKALVVQAVMVAIPFAILGLTLSDDFFEDYGWAVGPVVWLACSLLTAR